MFGYRFPQKMWSGEPESLVIHVRCMEQRHSRDLASKFTSVPVAHVIGETPPTAVELAAEVERAKTRKEAAKAEGDELTPVTAPVFLPAFAITVGRIAV